MTFFDAFVEELRKIALKMPTKATFEAAKATPAPEPFTTRAKGGVGGTWGASVARGGTPQEQAGMVKAFQARRRRAELFPSLYGKPAAAQS